MSVEAGGAVPVAAGPQPSSTAVPAAALAVLLRDLRLAVRRPGQVVQPLAFFAVVILLFPLGYTPELGKLRAIAVSGATRHPGLPNVPTIRELYPEYENYAWTSFFVRAEVPADVHAKLVSAMQTALRTPEMKRYFEANGSDPMVDFGPDRMAEHLRQEIARFRRVADAAGIKPE